MRGQLALAVEPTLTCVTRCWRCGVGWAVPVGQGETWQPAILWGYVALKAHERDVHGLAA